MFFCSFLSRAKREEYDGKTQPADPDDKSHVIDTNSSVIFEHVCSDLHASFFCGMLTL